MHFQAHRFEDIIYDIESIDEVGTALEYEGAIVKVENMEGVECCAVQFVMLLCVVVCCVCGGWPGRSCPHSTSSLRRNITPHRGLRAIKKSFFFEQARGEGCGESSLPT